MKNKIKILGAVLMFFCFSGLIHAQQNLCDTDADFLAPEANLTESYTELCGNNVTSNLTVNEDQEVIYRSRTSLRLTDGFQVKEGGIMQTADCDEHIIISNRNIQLSENMLVTPNPTSGSVQVEIDLDASTNLQLSLINPFGQIVQTFGQAQQYSLGLNTFTLEMGEFPAGIYIIQATDGKRTSSRKVVKQ